MFTITTESSVRMLLRLHCISELKAIQDRELHKTPDYHYLSRPERYSEGVHKASRFIRFVRDKTLDGRIDTYYFGKSVNI